MGKISVKAIIVKKGKVLLLKPKNSQGSFKGWDGPGGHVKEKESIMSALRREVFEETKIGINKAYLLKVVNILGIDVDYLIFLCPVSKAKVNLSDEHTDYQWVELSTFKDYLGEYFINDLKELNGLIAKLIS